MQAGRRTKHSGQNVCEMVTFKIFEFPAGSVPRTSRCSQGTEPGRRMATSAGGHGWGRCRGNIVGAKDMVSDRGNP
ncbi:unnamed protein product [Staurois parvus]|uniref:Uncharacterized protein n=1 Tax=Staurois parvus TaxID=386267 RepID=A0ABN9BHI5_9NEOB|nr:unnamed protein product [Staurois parvus]